MIRRFHAAAISLAASLAMGSIPASASVVAPPCGTDHS